MSKEKQIEEMAKDIHKADIAFLAKCIEDVENALNEDFVDKIITRQEFIAKYLYNAGYRKQSEWISVEERLPDIDELCLLSMENRITRYRWVVIGYYHTNYDEYVTHWMPLPEAPKKGGAE